MLDDRLEEFGETEAEARLAGGGYGLSSLEAALHERSRVFNEVTSAARGPRERLQARWSEARRQACRATIVALQAAHAGAFVDSPEWRGCMQLDIPRMMRNRQVSWQTPADGRAEILASAIELAEKALSGVFREGFAASQRDARVLGQMRKQAQLAACRSAPVVGMTSTFAALNSDLLHRLGPRVVVIEEAGELLECQLLACLSSPALQHVILIGDHQQLRPKVSNYELCRKHGFDLSLFERLVKAGSDRTSLTTQLRMHPDVSSLVRPFYARIDDHDRVRAYPMVPGVADRLCWVGHGVEEDGGGAGGTNRSKMNQHEAEFAARLAQHLVLNGIDKAKITLLTPYIGQKRELKRHLPQELLSHKQGEAHRWDRDTPRPRPEKCSKLVFLYYNLINVAFVLTGYLGL